jgi:hypothetical protein
MGKDSLISKFSMGCLQEIRSWIWFPTKIDFYTSADGNEFNLAGTINNTESNKDYIQKQKISLYNSQRKLNAGT